MRFEESPCTLPRPSLHLAGAGRFQHTPEAPAQPGDGRCSLRPVVLHNFTAAVLPERTFVSRRCLTPRPPARPGAWPTHGRHPGTATNNM